MSTHLAVRRASAAVAGVVVVMAASGCTQPDQLPPPPPAPTPSRATSTPVSTPTAAPTLKVPSRLPGEITRSVFTLGKADADGDRMANTSVVVRDAEPGTGGDGWILTGACAGPGEVGYLVEDASERASTDARPRPILTGTMPCSADRYRTGVPLKDVLVTIDFEVPDGVEVAWAAIVPR